MRILITLLLTAPVLMGIGGSGAPDDVESLVQQIKKARDVAEPELIEQLAGHQSREAAEGLKEVYGSMGSLFMKLEIVKALGTLDGVDGAEQIALQQIMDVATQAKERELREAAVETLGTCDRLGKTYLVMIVESAAEDHVRERALELHVAQGDAGDTEWYEKLYDLEDDEKVAKQEKKRKKREKKKRGKGDEGDEEAEDGVAKTPGPLRAMAFAAASQKMKDEKVMEALRDRYSGVRSAALRELDRRGHRDASKLALEKLERVDERPPVRIAAATIYAKNEGAGVTDTFIDLAKKDPSVTPNSLRFALADLLAEMRDPKVDKKVARLVGKGKSQEKLFSLRAGRYIDSDKVSKSIRKLLADKDPGLSASAAEILAQRGDVEAVPILLKRAEKAKDERLVTAALHAVSELKRGDEEWIAKLREYAVSESHDIRNAALIELGELGSAGNRELLEGALEHDLWSTRLAALQGLVALREPTVVGPIIARMKSETGRMLHEFADVLFTLTGKPYRTSVPSWEAWWKAEGKGFQLLTPEELEERIEEEEERRLKRISNVSFFGIRIISHRVIFVIDVSGSMNESTAGRYLGATGDTRMEIAKRELQQAIDGLPREALFNIVTFSSGVDTWKDRVQGSDDDNRAEAKKFVEQLGAGGATNLYDSIQEAFQDEDVDTIFILSDGEPTAGELTDPGGIRDDVRRWNENRKVVINTIAVGGELQILEWLAEDSGGSHVKYR